MKPRRLSFLVFRLSLVCLGITRVHYSQAYVQVLGGDGSSIV